MQCECMHAKSLQLCPTLFNPIHCSPPGSSVHGIPQARILEWVAMTPPRDLPDPGIEPKSLLSPGLAGSFFTTSGATWEAQCAVHWPLKHTELLKQHFTQGQSFKFEFGKSRHLMLLNYGVGEDSWESLGLQGDQTSQSWRKSILNIQCKDWCWSSNTLATWYEEPTH